jgi:hypothetical protein
MLGTHLRHALDSYLDRSFRMRDRATIMSRPKKFSEHRVVEQAMRVSWSQGYDGTSVADILRATAPDARKADTLPGRRQGSRKSPGLGCPERCKPITHSCN